jgi:outer membrane protein assembly factor BamB
MRHYLATLLLSPVLSLAGDWPCWRGPTMDGRWEPAALPADFAKREPHQLWTLPVGKGYGGVTVAGEQVFLMDRQTEGSERERVLCVDASSGKLSWMHEWPVTYGEMGGYATGPRGSVLIAGDKVYAMGATGMVCCLQRNTGEVVWQRAEARNQGAKMPQWGFSASPVLHAGRLLLHLGGVLAVDPDSGKPLWHGGEDDAGYSTPEVFSHGGRSFIAQWGPKQIEILDAVSGQRLWAHDYKITYGVSIAQPLVAGGMLLVSGYWHGTKAFALGADPAQTRLVWEEEKQLCGLMSSALEKEGVAYLLQKTDGLTAFEIKTGRILWKDGNTLTPKDKNPQMSLVWLAKAKNLAALVNADGELVYVRLTPAGREELGRHQIIGKTWAHPAFTADRIYARSDTQLVAAQLW